MNDMTWSEGAALWLECDLRPRVGDRRYGEVARLVETWGRALGRRPLSTLSERDIGAWWAALDGAPHYLRLQAQVMRQLSRWLLSQGLLTSDPTSTLRPPRAPEPTISTYSEEELDTLERAALDVAPLWWHLFLVLLRESGLRRSTVRQLESGDLDQRRALWMVPAARMKGRRRHTVPATSRAVDAVMRAGAISTARPRLFGEATVDRERHYWDATRRQAGLGGSLHDFRRTFITRLFEAGVDLEVVGRMAAQARPEELLPYYRHVRDSHLTGALEAFERQRAEA